jgi:chemotaxis protein MotB
VDALSALLMVVIFVLLIFIVSHFLLSQVLSGQESELARLHQRIEELADLLGLEKERNRQMNAQLTELSAVIEALGQTKDDLTGQVAALTQQSQDDRDKIKDQLFLIASLHEDIDALRRLRGELEQEVAALAEALTSSQQEAGALRDRSKTLQARLADEQERTLLAQQEIEQRDIRIRALSAIVGQQEKAIDEERALSADARAEIALLNEQLTNLRHQMEEIDQALKVAEAQGRQKDQKIEDLGKRLNIALARRVNELERYRSEFFGRLRTILGENPLIRTEGDRFVLQAELLFASGSADLGDAGRRHLADLAQVLRSVAGQIPDELNWILRIDGHTDRVPIRNEQFSSNWDLSTARAVSVVRFLASQGIPEDRMAATGFSKFHPVDPAATDEAFRKNRRIEIKLTSR